MKKNENIAISLQVQRGKDSKSLFLCVQFDKTAPNFAIDNDSITWYPTNDEIDFIADAFHLIGENKEEKNIKEKEALEPTSEIRPLEPSIRSSERRIPSLIIGEHKEEKKAVEKDTFEPTPEIKPLEPSIRSSEIRIPPLSDDSILGMASSPEAARVKGDEVDEKIFVQADDKKIDEILKRRKAKIEKEFARESEEKSTSDRMFKQKKKKE